jgi:hypothetical protein
MVSSKHHWLTSFYLWGSIGCARHITHTTDPMLIQWNFVIGVCLPWSGVKSMIAFHVLAIPVIGVWPIDFWFLFPWLRVSCDWIPVYTFLNWGIFNQTILMVIGRLWFLSFFLLSVIDVGQICWLLADCFAWDNCNWLIAFQIFLLGVFWEVKCFNQKWLHHHQLESYSKKKMKGL